MSNGVAPRASVANHGIASRLSIESKFETTSAPRRRLKSRAGALTKARLAVPPICPWRDRQSRERSERGTRQNARVPHV